MPPKKEREPKADFELTAEQRKQLVANLVPEVDKTVQIIEKSEVADKAKPYAILVGLTAVLKYQTPDNDELILSPEEILHVRKMVGHETRKAKKYGGRVKGLKAITSDVESIAGEEIETVGTFPAEMILIPIDYRNAFVDLGKLEESINELKAQREVSAEDLMMKALRKTYEQAKAKRGEK